MFEDETGQDKSGYMGVKQNNYSMLLDSFEEP